MSEEKKGIKELKELVVFVAIAGNAIDVSTKDGLQAEDIASYIPAFMAAPEAFTGFKEIPAEAKDLDSVELQELKDAVADKLDLADDELEAIVEDSLAVIASLFGIAEKIKAKRAEA